MKKLIQFLIYCGYSKKSACEFIIQVLISVLTALAAALSTTSCIGLHQIL